MVGQGERKSFHLMPLSYFLPSTDHALNLISLSLHLPISPLSSFLFPSLPLSLSCSCSLSLFLFLLVCIFQLNVSNKKPGTLYAFSSPVSLADIGQGLSELMVNAGRTGVGRLVIENTGCLAQRTKFRVQQLVRRPRGWGWSHHMLLL